MWYVPARILPVCHMIPSGSHTRNVQRISSALVRGGFDLLGKSGSRPGNSLVDLDILGSQQRDMQCHVLVVTIPS